MCLWYSVMIYGVDVYVCVFLCDVLFYFFFFCVFFFKQKTAYEMLRSLVGSEMCIRDRSGAG